LHGLDPRGPQELKLVALIAATVTATITRYIALRTWVFSRDRRAVSDRADRTSLHAVTH
jgi:putative flippase GtrA